MSIYNIIKLLINKVISIVIIRPVITVTKNVNIYIHTYVCQSD